jgi:hypothetical protein
MTIIKIEKQKNMRFNSLTIDNFYENPNQVREFALKQEFEVRGNYPGMRTKSFLTDSLKKKFRDILYPFAGEITWWGGEYTGSFQYTTASDRSWIHADSTTDWAAVCYLTPNAPVTAGTGIFKHKETGWMHYDYKQAEKDPNYNKFAPPGDEMIDYTKWEMVDRVGNVFNRLIMYRADNYHVSLDYFGKDLYDGRLFQVFFFNTEK